MKKLFLVLALLIFSLYGSAQVYQEIKSNRVILTGNGVLRPLRDTVTLNATDSASIAYKNGKYYSWSGYKYNAFAFSDTLLYSTKLFTQKIINDTAAAIRASMAPSVTASNGLSKVVNDIRLGGLLNTSTFLYLNSGGRFGIQDNSTGYLFLDINNTGSQNQITSPTVNAGSGGGYLRLGVISGQEYIKSVVPGKTSAGSQYNLEQGIDYNLSDGIQVADDSLNSGTLFAAGRDNGVLKTSSIYVTPKGMRLSVYDSIVIASTRFGTAARIVHNQFTPILSPNQLTTKKYVDSLRALAANFTLTTTGTSGPATYTGGILNIPQYSGGGGSGVTNVATGFGLSGGPITSTGTIQADTSQVSTKAFAQKILNDSAAAIRNSIPSGGGGGGSQKGAALSLAPGTATNQDFVVMATAIVIPTSTWSYAAPISWEFLTNTSGHGYSFFDSVYGNTGNQRLVIRHPNVKQVLSTIITPDESFGANGIFVGATSGLTTLEVQANSSNVFGATLIGSGSSTWGTSGQDISNSLLSYTGFNNANGATLFNFNVYGPDYGSVSVTYNGPNDWKVKLLHSGLGIYNIGFQVLDRYGNPVTDYPTSVDEFIIRGGTRVNPTLALGNYAAGNEWLGSFTNLWVFGMFECYMVANPVSSSSISIRWQPYTSATSYKIYRSTTPNFASPTLVYSGSALSYTDTGLTPATNYYYKMVAVISAVDTEITTFNTNTNF